MPFASCNEMIDGSSPLTFDYWGMQDNDSGNQITGVKGINVPIVGAFTTSAMSVADSPVPWIPRSMEMQLSTGRVAQLIGDFNDIAKGPFTFFARSKCVSSGNNNAAIWGMQSGSSSDGYRNVPVRSAYPSTLGWFRSVSANAGYNNPLADPTWQHTATQFNPGIERRLVLDGSVAHTTAWNIDLSSYDFSSLEFGFAALASSGPPVNRIADFVLVEGYLSLAEINEHRLGPEPLPLGNPSIIGSIEVGQELSLNVASWNNRNNGSLVRQWQWQRYDGISVTNIAGATNNTYTITLDDAGYQIRVRELAGNDGGVDERQWVSSQFTDLVPYPFNSFYNIGVSHLLKSNTDEKIVISNLREFSGNYRIIISNRALPNPDRMVVQWNLRNRGDIWTLR